MAGNNYAGGRLKSFRDDTKLIVDAAAQAEKAPDYILDRPFCEGRAGGPMKLAV